MTEKSKGQGTQQEGGRGQHANCAPQSLLLPDPKNLSVGCDDKQRKIETQRHKVSAE